MTQPLYSAIPPDSRRRQADPVVLRIEKGGRGGKTVTVISRLQFHPAGKEELLRKLKSSCGAGGTMKNDDLEIQGDHRPRLKTLLEEMGYRVRGA